MSENAATPSSHPPPAERRASTSSAPTSPSLSPPSSPQQPASQQHAAPSSRSACGAGPEKNTQRADHSSRSPPSPHSSPSSAVVTSVSLRARSATDDGANCHAAAHTANTDAVADTEQEIERSSNDRRALYIGGLEERHDEEHLRALFPGCVNVKIVCEHGTQHRLGYGFVEFATTAQASSALDGWAEKVGANPADRLLKLNWGQRFVWHRMFCANNTRRVCACACSLRLRTRALSNSLTGTHMYTHTHMLAHQHALSHAHTHTHSKYTCAGLILLPCDL
jgi:RNA recognition motif